MATAPPAPTEFSFSSAIRGYHVYKSTWQPFIGEHLELERENGNAHDRFAVAVIKICPARRTQTIVGHIPREISSIIWHFLSHGGKCTVTEIKRRSPLVQGGLEVPCCITLSGKKKLAYKAETVIKNASNNNLIVATMFCMFQQ